MFLLEEDLILDGIATPLNQLQFPDYPAAVSAFNTYIKQSDNHWIVLFHTSNPFEALAIK